MVPQVCRPLLATAVLLAAVLLSPGTPAQWRALETDDLRLIYIDPTQTFMTPHVARSYESAMEFYIEFFRYRPWEPVTVKLLDISDAGGGSAGVLPTNSLAVSTSPLSFAFETMPPGERVTTVMNHELLHLVSMDRATGSDVKARRFFRGKVLPTPDHPETLAYLYLTTPRVAVPSWYQEGSAVFMETWMAGGLGRAQGAYDEMVFRAMVEDGAHFYDPLGLVSAGIRVDFQAGVNSYLYGTRFMSYLAYEYSPELLVEWFARLEGSKKYYASEFRRLFGVSIPEAWKDWIEWEHGFQEANLAAIREYPVTPYRDLSPDALGSVSRAYFDPSTRQIHAAFNYPGVVAHVGRISIDDGKVERVQDVKAPVIYAVTSLTYDPDSGRVFYTTDNSAYRDLRVIEPGKRKSRLLLKDARVGDLAFNRADGSVWGIRHFNGVATLVRVPAPYDEWNQVHSWPFGEVIYDLSLSPDGTLVSLTLAEINGRHGVRVFETAALLEGRVEPVHEFDLGGTILNDFTFSPDGRYLYGSSYYTGVSNIFRFELEGDGIECVSNSETGFFRPIPLGDDRLIVFRYTGEGFVPAEIEAQPLEDVNPITFLGQQVSEKHPVVREWVPRSPRDVPLEERTLRDDEYHPLGAVSLESIYPVIEGYKDSGAIGLSANLSDPMFFNRFSFTASYSPDPDLPSDERMHLHFRYYRPNWEADLKWNDADFYDLFGPTKFSRKGYSASVKYDKSLIYDLPRQLDLTVQSTYYGDMDQLPRYQNVEVDIDRLLEGFTQLRYSNIKASLGAVDYEKGIVVEGIAGATYVDNDLIPGVVANLDLGFALPWRHSSIWLRSSAGANSGNLDDPFANFFFGGFGNNWVDHGNSKRYRDFFSFPGVELNEIPGRTYAKTMLEWNLPPLRFTRVGTPGSFLTWARTSLFASGIETNPGEEPAGPGMPDPNRRLANLGAQIDLRFTVMSKFKMTLSVGYALAFEEGVDRSDEWMVSLNVLD